MPKADPKEFKHASFPSYFDGSKRIKPTAIVLHWWETPINDRGVDYLIELFAKRELSVQFSVLANGDIYQLTPFADNFCRHAKCANNSSIGIEIEGEGPLDLDTNHKQFEQVTSLVKYLQGEFSIPAEFSVEGGGESIRFHGITSHKNVDIYCSDANGKKDVHDAYLERVLQAVN